jgi:hypothetical protein
LQAIYDKKNNLLSAVASDNIIDCVEHLVEYLSYKVFGQAIYRHMTNINNINKLIKTFNIINRLIF